MAEAEPPAPPIQPQAPQQPQQPAQPPIPPDQPIPAQHTQHISQLNFLHFNPEFAGKPERDAEAHVLRTNDWMNTHQFPEGVKIQRF